ncbi:MAG: DoxX family protein [Planctomycetes bacterium GWF2_40_8]|nr:MAG: DoxX family protein [Planctomycetes bacterium GWF2_40_8]OHC04338.1 MAG: DoxX family protein [Planctomycetes bacterium RIFCSPLOWO2_12_FULL_40_19]
MIFRFLDKYRDIGLLILRVGIGIMFMCHGLPKLIAGPETWTMLGGAMKSLEVGFTPMVWGFMAAFSEFAGGLLLVPGFFTRPACFFLLATMIVATSMHIGKGDPFLKYSHAMEAGILFLSLIFIGPGKYSLDDQIISAKGD